MADRPNTSRSVKGVVNSVSTLEGGGFLVHRPFPTGQLPDLDPFLLLDEMGPMDVAPGEAKGAPDHPHRGFETVTYLLSGNMEHRDSQGNSGSLGPGDVQWMTAGAGVIHSEMPAKEFQRTGGRMHGFQLWVNLPRKEKMTAPRYQDVPAAKIPTAQSDDGASHVKVIAGEAMGKKAVIHTRIPIAYLHFTLQPGAKVTQSVPRDQNALAYVVEGEGTFGSPPSKAGRGQMVHFANDADAISFENIHREKPLSVLLIAGTPLREPVARYGPFVMNTPAEIRQAFEDFNTGNFGAIPAQVDRVA